MKTAGDRWQVTATGTIRLRLASGRAVSLDDILMHGVVSILDERGEPDSASRAIHAAYHFNEVRIIQRPAAEHQNPPAIAGREARPTDKNQTPPGGFATGT